LKSVELKALSVKAGLLGAPAALREELAMPLTPIARADHDHAANVARTALGAEAFEAVWSTGHVMLFEEAISEAVGADG
jgi:hypothetical protein